MDRLVWVCDETDLSKPIRAFLRYSGHIAVHCLVWVCDETDLSKPIRTILGPPYLKIAYCCKSFGLSFSK